MEVKKTSLFKKPKVRKKFAKRKIANLEDDDDDDQGYYYGDGTKEQSGSTGTGTITTGIDTNREPQQNRDNPNHPLQTVNNHDDSILQKIQSIKKSRKIKDQIRTRGLGAALANGQNHHVSLKKVKTMEADGGTATLRGQEGQEKDSLEDAEAIANQDLKQRLEGNFAIKGCNTNEEDGNILMQKHKLAMEEYIQGQIIKDSKDDGGMQQNTRNDNNNGECNALQNEESLLQVKNTNDLYSKILQDAKQQLQSAQYENNKSVAIANGGIMEDSDIGAGGAMLGGTGIAEVALPVEERIKAARETELAAARMERERTKKRYGGGSNGDLESDEMDKMETSYETMLPTSFGAGRGKQRRNRNPTIYQSQQDEHPSNILTQQSDSSTHRRDPVLSRVLHKNSMPGIGSSYSHNFRLHNDEWIQKQKQQQHLLLQQEEKEKRIGPMEEQGEVDDSNRIGFEARKRRKDHPKSSDKASSGGKKKVERAHDDVVYKKFVTRELQNIRR